MYERLADDRRLLTLSLASGVGIGMGGEKAYKAWLAAQAEAPTSQNAADRQRAAISRLQTLFAQQPSAALRDAMKVD